MFVTKKRFKKLGELIVDTIRFIESELNRIYSRLADFQIKQWKFEEEVDFTFGTVADALTCLNDRVSTLEETKSKKSTPKKTKKSTKK